MAWPRATDYTSAIQNPSSCFSDPELSRGQAASDMLMGLPLMYAGNFASVFEITCPGEQAWAVKCFTRQVADLQERYQQISDHLERQKRKFAVEFVYLAEGIRINGVWYPILKMRWVEGFTLNEFLRDHAAQPALIDQLALLWLRLVGELRDAKMAHGDLQHGNVMLVPGSKSTSLALRLIDYDGMWVPALASRPPGELGHPNYQHPQRLAAGGYDAEIDRFAHLVIFTAMRALAVGGQALWDRHDNGENLLFRAADFSKPGKSKLLVDLMTLAGDDLHALVGHLIDASQRPLAEVPLLTDIVEGSRVVPLSPVQVERLREWLPGTTAPQRAASTARQDSAGGLPDYLTVAKTVLVVPGEPSSPPDPSRSATHGPIAPTRLEVGSERPPSSIAATRLEVPSPPMRPVPRTRLEPTATGRNTPPPLEPSRARHRDKTSHKTVVIAVAGLLVVLLGAGVILGVRNSRSANNKPSDLRSAAGQNTGGSSDTKPEVSPIFAEQPNEITNSIGMRLVRIPAGKFSMGSFRGERSANEEPEHEVEITKAFHLGVHEVTQKQFEAVMRYNPSHFSRNGKGKQDAQYDNATKPAGGKDKLNAQDDPDEFPVENVSWDEAKEFCEKLSAMEQAKGYTRVYRIPTEAEWEYSCRGGTATKTAYHVGNTLTSAQANFKDSNLQRTCKVGSYQPNGYGLYDMHGNVLEWCSDWYGETYYAAGPKADPPGMSNGSQRVVRGGGWYDDGGNCRSAKREWNQPTHQYNDFGFRVTLVSSKDPIGKDTPKARPSAITNSIGMKLVRIPAGKFMMGSPAGEGSENERPEHEVEITKAFHLGIHEVTQKQFEAVMGYNPSYFSRNAKGKKGVTYFFSNPAGGMGKLKPSDNPDVFPVENVAWEEAKEFCEKLSAMEKEKDNKRVYRLPTESEWEYACRGGAATKSAYNVGNILSSSQANLFNKLERTCAGGSFEPNNFGLYDMHGNVWEWCSDWYGEKYYATSPRNDPSGPSEGSNRMFRGGCWVSGDGDSRSAIRGRNTPAYRTFFLGFRVALVLSKEPISKEPPKEIPREPIVKDSSK